MNIWDILILLVIAGIIIIAWRAAKGSGGCKNDRKRTCVPH